MNKKVLASIISLSAVGVLGVGIVCANADKSPVPDIPKTAEAYCRLTEIEFDGNPEIKTFDINDYEDYEYKDISHGIQ